MYHFIFILSFVCLLQVNAKKSALSRDKWYDKTLLMKDSKEAELVYRVGDIDNLNQGFEYDYNPFEGKSTYPHRFPFYPQKDDPDGTDRIMVASKYDYASKLDNDGYTSSTKRPDNIPRPIKLNWGANPTKINNIKLQLFVDDFQVTMFKKTYHVTIDGERIPYLEAIVNTLAQSGPIGKLLTIDILPEYFHLFEDAKIELKIDDPITAKGDGFAIDFVQIMINKRTDPVGAVKGVVLNYNNQKPLDSALVQSTSGARTYSDKNGVFVLESVSAGMAVLSGAKEGYQLRYITTDVVANKATENVKIELKPVVKENSGSIKNELITKGKIELYGIQFDKNSDVIKSSSIPALEELATMLKQNESIKLELSGHTDADGSEQDNQKLSDQRIEAVKQWLLKKGVTLNNVALKGYGESKPIASNQSEIGKALNRRVEIKVIQ